MGVLHHLPIVPTLHVVETSPAPDRSARREVRNPLLALPDVRALIGKETITRDELIAALRNISDDCAAKAQKSWRQNKGPMAAYHKACGVYAKHLKNVLRMGQRAVR